MEKVIDRARGKLKGKVTELANQIAGILKGLAYKVDLAAKAAKIVKGASKAQHGTTMSPGALSAGIPSVDSRQRPTRRLRTIGKGAGVMVLVASALLSGCYYRGRPPEYGRRGYGHRYDRRY